MGHPEIAPGGRVSEEAMLALGRDHNGIDERGQRLAGLGGVQPRYGQKPPSAVLNGDFRCSGGHGLSVLGFDRNPNHEIRHLIRVAETHSKIHRWRLLSVSWFDPKAG